MSDYTPEHLKLWTDPNYYLGDTWYDYYVFLGQCRDSGMLDRSNFTRALELIGGETKTVVVARARHWGVGLDTVDHDIAPETLAEMRRDCEDFMRENAEDLINIPLEHAGHDFWLTRNGHGTGFWDRGMGEVGTRLTAASETYGTVDLLLGEDGLIHS